MEDLNCLAERIRKAVYNKRLSFLNVTKCSSCGKEVCFYFYHSRTWDVLYGSMCGCATEPLKPSSWLSVAKYYREQDENKKKELDNFFGFERTFKPFEKVLVPDVVLGTGECIWKADFFSHKREDCYVCIGRESSRCIPYEGNEHLIGKEVAYMNGADLDSVIVRDAIQVNELDINKF